MLAHDTVSNLSLSRRFTVFPKPRRPSPLQSSITSRSFTFLTFSRRGTTQRSRAPQLPVSSRLSSSFATCSSALRNWIEQESRYTPPRHYLTRTQPYSTSPTANPAQNVLGTIKDDSHPSLYYHLFDDPSELLNPVFALSFLEEKPASARSRAVLGWLPALSPLSEGEMEGGENGLNDFRQNEDFLPILHKTVRESLLEDEIWTNSAIQTQSGWMHIYDQRKIPPLGRIPEPDDILASVRVEDGQMLMETYEPMPSYRLCTADGVCQLTDTLMDRLKAALRRIVEEEEEEEEEEEVGKDGQAR